MTPIDIPDESLRTIHQLIAEEAPDIAKKLDDLALDIPEAPQEPIPVTFTPAQLIAWADKQEEWGTSPAWSKNQDDADGYARAMRHLRYYVKNPIQEII